MLLRAFYWIVRELRVRRDPIGFARSLGVTVGDGCWLIATSPATWGSEPYLVRLGSRVLVTEGVRFIAHDGAVWLRQRTDPTLDRIAPIVVNDDVFIGLRAMILPGVTIGSNSIIGAGAVVVHDVPTGSVVAGVPARVICSVEEYWRKHAADFSPTRRLSPEAKRQALRQKFGLHDGPA